MSDDLISRKALLDSLRGNVLVDVTPEIEKAVEEQQTACDKGKVIEELKANMSSVQGISGQAVTFMFSDGYYNGIKDAIEIVEKGGGE